ncbi:MAG: sugar phosphate isomerase/epimerase [Bacillota bacterium]|nr:sugar phosphate isomerase/epimerase [Bacillota bacterium]
MKKFKIGLQLYSVRDDLKKDFEGTLQKIKKMGYDYVEFAGYYNRSAEEIKEILGRIGLEAMSVHQTYVALLEDEKATVDYIKALGVKYYAIPWMNIEKLTDPENYKNTIDEFKKAGKILKDAGIQFLYHNHDFEFTNKIGDKTAFDTLYEAVPSDLLETEIDTCWVRYAGYDPAAYIREYSGRAHVVHLKDFICKNFNMGPVYALIDSNGNDSEKPKSKDEVGFEFRPIGSGVQDIPSILEAAEEAGAEYLIVEQDLASTASPLECAKQSREYLKSLGQ